MIKAVIFDMDGLLIDSEPLWRRVHVATVANEGFRITEDDVRAMAGLSTKDVVERWQQRFGWSQNQNPRITAAILKNMIEQVRASGKPLPGVAQLIERLRKRNLKLAVASSSPPELIDAALNKLGLAYHMDVIHSAIHEKRAKPFPDVFIATAKQLRVQPDECIVFEDSPNGVKAAKAAGMRCIAVPEPAVKSHPYIQIADVILESLEDVTEAMLQA